jgi:hypothetical protein
VEVVTWPLAPVLPCKQSSQQWDLGAGAPSPSHRPHEQMLMAVVWCALSVPWLLVSSLVSLSPPCRHCAHCPPHEQLLARLVVCGVLFWVPSHCPPPHLPLASPRLPIAPHFYPTSSCLRRQLMGLQWSWLWVSFPSPHRLVVPPLVISLPLCFPPPPCCCHLPLIIISLPLIVWWCLSLSSSSFHSLELS